MEECGKDRSHVCKGKAMKSILTEYLEISAFSGRPAECVHHCIYGQGLRMLADEDKLLLPLTNSEHNMSSKGTINQIHGNSAAEKLSKIAGQLAYEKEYYRRKCKEEGDPARESFLKRYGCSYL